MATTQWGRKETIIFPPHSPIYTYGAVFLAFVLTGCFVYLRFSFGQTPLQQFYTPIYARTAAGAVLQQERTNISCFMSATAPERAELAAEATCKQVRLLRPEASKFHWHFREQQRARDSVLSIAGRSKYTLTRLCTST